ncbi:efflux RND transporter permease subunit [Marinilongibacter aquaticus]|uniref:efflux RND transporter permease subunit n=1 Tax=Marinilongibacter aquaticus TaxID=2975157 RepID=UPI0021BD5F7C|nr:efflux RND transporter permease subunit [Marinilongibacter aquaticus]UBM59130.1 efflux RND transporter permease subunit [Marinilongibacter aquaticus]
MNVSELAVKRPSLFIVIFAILALLGIISYSTLSYELLPKINAPVLTVTTIYPGASPSEVENSVTKKVEQQVSGIEDVDKVTSTSYEGVSVVVVKLKYSADIDQSVQTAQRKVNSIYTDLPEGVKQPTVDKISLDELPVLKIGATSDMTPTAFSDLIANKITPALARLEGVARVDVMGDTKREIKVNVNSAKLETYNLSILQVTQSIATANLDFPTGKIKDNESQLIVRLSGKLHNVSDLRNLVITNTQESNPIFLSDVAEVVDGTEDYTYISRLNGGNSVGLSIVKQSDGNAVEVSELVHAELDKLSKEYAQENLQFEISSDTSTFTLEAANGVIHDLLIAVVLVALIMMFFLHSPRNATIVMVSIPLSIVSTFIAMSVLGYSLNLMSLLGLSLVVGILVDDSIVVLENIFTHLEKGQTPWQAAISTGKEIGLSVASITLVIVVVFLPILFVTGTIADLLRQFSVVIIVATLMSLVVSFTITPFLASRFTKVVHIDKSKWYNLPFKWFDDFQDWLDASYRKLLDWSLSHKTILLAGIFALIVASLSLFKLGLIGSEFVSAGDNGEFVIEAELSKDATIEQTNLAALKIEQVVRRHPEVENVFTTVGAASAGSTNQSQANSMLVNVKMVPLEERSISSKDFSVLVKRELFNALPGVDVKAKAVGITGGTTAPIQVIVESNDLDTLLAWSEKVKTIVKNVPGTTEIESSVEGGNPELEVTIDRKRMADLGLSMNTVGATLQNSLAGNDDSKFTEGDNDYNINVKLDEFNRSNPEDLLNLVFMSNRGQLIRLSQFATVSRNFGPTKLERNNKVSSTTITAFVVGRPTGSVGSEIEAQINALQLPRDVNISMGGDLENQKDSFQSLGAALLVSLILVYLIMVALYDNWAHPFVVMFSIPVAIIGAFLALALSLQNMSIFTMLGLIMLIGLVVKNAILIVDNINHMKAKGIALMQAIKEGTMERFRPILMTTIAMVFAMLPVALAQGAGAEWKNGLSWVLIGGLTSSMLLTMLIVPVMYYLVERAGMKLRGRKQKAEK